MIGTVELDLAGPDDGALGVLDHDSDGIQLPPEARRRGGVAESAAVGRELPDPLLRDRRPAPSATSVDPAGSPASSSRTVPPSGTRSSRAMSVVSPADPRAAISSSSSTSRGEHLGHGPRVMDCSRRSARPGWWALRRR
ncbi:hypothetical protein [Brachybacterium sacelli]|uniref:hypothetical protein n=1 Tax=Brachybacterium sacelli TaxID=173364 RepID=UPI00361E98E3